MNAFSVRPRRTALYVPATSARALQKARTADCDIVIIDLEDMVAPMAKIDARILAVDEVDTGGFGSREVVIRCNGLDTPWGREDLLAAAASDADAILIPKISCPGELERARALLGDGPRIWAMIETSGALLRLDALGSASRSLGVDAWVIGSNDLAKDLHCSHEVDRPGLLTGLSMSIAAARHHGLAILDGIFMDLRDSDGLERQCAQGAALGFDGKTVIHPHQLSAANSAFTPPPALTGWARAVVAAFDAPENHDAAILEVEGGWVERPHLARAAQLVAIADAIAALDR
nr:CoA ester lyase [Sphingomonas sp. CDS-1]